jgi:alkanesulfonate monooxygenase SsuD/methylene tetrahydromethanopterin reductase-like flavin-dependent oxidoreductase (luciferase family)
MASPNLMAAALSRRTPNNSAICVLGNTLALYSPATRVAEEFAMLDVLTDGRLIAGFPVGTSMDVNFCYGITPTETRPRFKEAHELIIDAWTKPGPFTFNGRYNQLRYVNPWPKPLQKPHPPVWLAGGGSVETWEMAANYDYTYSYLSFFGFQYGKKLMDGFWDTMDRMGKDKNPYRAGFAQQICVSETDERAEEEYLEHVSYFFNKCLHIPPYFFEAPGYRTRRSTEFAIKTNQPGEIAKVAVLEKNWKTLVDNGFIIAGSPQTVADRIIDAAKQLRVGNLHALLQIGSMPHDLTEKNITLFAEEVLPRIRKLWADEGWEHKWWPTGAQDRTPSRA